MIDVGRDFEQMQDYVVGRLSDEERRTFEDRLVRDPELVREFEQSLRLREGFQQLRAQGYFERSAPRARGFRIWPAALAAAAIAGVALFLWPQPHTEPSPVLMASLESRTAGAVAPSIAAHFTFVSMREASTPDLDSPAAGLIEFRAAPGGVGTTASRYRVTLIHHNEGGSLTPVATLTGLAVSTDGYVHCYADAPRLGPGSYVLRLESDADPAGTAEVFPFNLRARAAP